MRTSGPPSTLHDAALRALPDGLLVLDGRGAVVACNEAAATLLGRTAESLIGAAEPFPPRRTLGPFRTPGEETEMPHRVTLRTGEPRDRVLVGVTHDAAAPTWLAVSTRPLRHPECPGGVVVSLAEVGAQLSVEADAERSRILHEGLMHSVTDAVVTIDHQGTVTAWNPQATALFGHAEADALGAHISFLVPEHRRAASRDRLARLLETAASWATPQAFTIPTVRRDGQTMPVTVSLSLVTTAGNPTFLLRAHPEDVQGPDQGHAGAGAAAAMQLGQSRFLDGAPAQDICLPLLIALVDTTASEFGFVAEVTTGADATIPLKPVAVFSRSWDDDTRAHFLDVVATSTRPVSVGTPFEAACQVESPWIVNTVDGPDAFSGNLPGQPVLTRTLGIPLHFGGRLIGLIGLANRATDYTASVLERAAVPLSTLGQLLAAIRANRERQQALAALQASAERDLMMRDAIGIGGWEWNPQTDEAHWDEPWCRIIGHGPAELTHSGRAWTAMIHPDDLTAALLTLERHLNGDSPLYRAEFRLRHKRGHWVWVQTMGRVVQRDELGRATRVVGLQQDISQRVQWEIDISRARDVAERANRAKSDFLASMSHEIRTPMNGVIGFAHLLLDTALSDLQRNHVQTIRRSGEALLSLINDILDLSKIEAERMEMEEVPFDLTEAVADAAEMVLPRVREKGLDLVVDWRCPPVTHLLGDPKRIRQVILNLAGNAVKFTSAGAIVLTVERDTDATLRIAVHDRGIGIPLDKQGIIFDKFSQADRSTTRKFGGTGLGLAISRRLVELMGGEIGVHSIPGEGSTFWFTLPAPTSIAPDSKTPSLPGVRVAITTEVPESRTALANLCTHAGATVVDQAAPHGDVVLLEARDADTLDTMIARHRRRLGSELAPCVAVVAAHLMPEVARRLQGAPGITLRAGPVLRPDELVDALRTAAGLHTHDSALRTDELRSHRGGAAPVMRRSGRILLADDNDVNAMVGVAMLERLGFEVDVAENGRRAVELAHENTYLAIFMDCDMPEMDGYEATAALRAREQDPQVARVPIIALTAHALVEARERCLAAGMDDYLAKPIVPDTVAAMVARWIPAHAT